MQTNEQTTTINLSVATNARQARAIFNLPDGLPPFERAMPELHVRAFAELVAVSYRELGPDPATRDALDSHIEASRYHADHDLVRLIQKAEDAVQGLAQWCRDARWSGMPIGKCPTNFFVDPTAASSLMACLVGVHYAAVAGQCITELGRKDTSEIMRRAAPSENMPLRAFLKMLSHYHHIAPGTEAELAKHGYTAAELLIDLACAHLIERLEGIQAFAERADTKDIESAARGALQTARQARKIIADGVAYTLREK